MTLAIFYSGYLPGEKYGGPVTSIYNFTELMGDDNEIFIICTNHDLKETKPYSGIIQGWNIVGKAQVIYLKDEEYGKIRFLEILDEIKPDIIYASSIFSAKQTYPLFDLSIHLGIPLLLAPRGELNNNALSIKPLKKKIYILFLKLLKKLSFTYYQATSSEEKKNIIDNLGVDANKVFLLPNIPALPVHKEIIEKQTRQIKLCYVGRIVKNKNLLLALKAVIESKAEVLFDIFGPKEVQEYWEECQKVIDTAPPNVKITYRGVFSPQQMRKTYKDYDCLISPTQFENYGQAIVEAMLSDVPVIISKGTTPWDNIQEKQVGMTASLNNVKQFTEAIEKIANMDSSRYKDLIDRLRVFCLEQFDYNLLKYTYNETFLRILSFHSKGNIRDGK